MTKLISEPTAWNPHPNRIWPPIPTLARTTMGEVSDQDVGLPHDPKAQQRAEAFVRAALSLKAKQELRATGKPIAIRIALPAQGDEMVEIALDTAEMLGAVASKDRWSQ